ncbi:MAG: nitrogenase [Spirochaetes bacterium]|nr:nitrogenase [Spirochaetota bacterium]
MESRKNNIKEGLDNIVTINACKLCTPLGACIAFKGIQGCMTILHGSQGCATYIRRYLISHYREPIDIASSSFDENAAIFGGGANLVKSISNVRRQYNPEVLAIATSCLSETIGDDIEMIVKGIESEEKIPIIPVSTASYRGTHREGFYAALLASVKSLAEKKDESSHINIISGMLSPEDIRYLKAIAGEFSDFVLLPDYSETLDSGSWGEYEKIAEGGTAIEDIRSMGSAAGTIELGGSCGLVSTAGKYLEEKFEVPLKNISLPVGLRGSDLLINSLSKLSGKEIPESIKKERLRLLDAYADAHKYLFGVKAIVYGEEDLAVALSSFLSELGISIVLCASGSNTGSFKEEVEKSIIDFDESVTHIAEGVDFEKIDEIAAELEAEIVIGNSKGYKLASKFGIPLIRTGFPIHDRFGGQRIQHVGYKGAMMLLDNIVNAVLETQQKNSSVIYNYM